jgi:hypothetical protein
MGIAAANRISRKNSSGDCRNAFAVAFGLFE